MTDANRAQAEYWTSSAGLAWIEHERALDAAMAGMLDLLMAAAAIAPAERVLDIGCGTGASTLAAAARAARGRALGVDISAPLLERAAFRAHEAGVANAGFLLADAQSHGFGAGGFDILVSRVGMSFFSDAVAALRNLGRALAPDGRMAFVTWAGVDGNPWFQLPKRAAEQRLGPLPPGDPAAPGPTAFQDIARVAGLMRQAGLRDIEAVAAEIVLTPPDAASAARAAARVGPAARILKGRGGTEADALAIEEAVGEALRDYVEDGEVQVPATVNLFCCRV